MNSLFKSKARWCAFALLMVVISCSAFGRSPQQEAERQDRPVWPKEIETPNGRIMVYEPQLESFKGTRLKARAAISAIPAGAADPVFGGLWLDAELTTDTERRIATPINVKVTEIRFPNLEAADAAEFRQAVAEEFLRWKLSYSVDDLHAQLKLAEERKAAAQAIRADVPQIIFRSQPAVLLMIDGEPAWRELPGSSYRRIANSPFFVVQESEKGACYLHIPPFWWSASDPMGPWQAIDAAPGAVADLWKNEPKPQLPPADPDQEAPARPEVIPVSQPAELVCTDGHPQFAPISGTDLLYVKNTESDVFLDIETQLSYVLLSGRWYRTVSGKIAWEFVPSDKLPVDFSRIPLSSEKQHVLACVAGTAQAREAVRNSEIPQTVAVKPGPAPDRAVTYEGEPQFTEVRDVPVRYAVNTTCPVFAVDRRYYWCEEGIWYDSDFAVGPWDVCSYVPPAIYLIPPSCPFYYVTYCRLFSVRPGAIYFGYYPGYRGCYVWGRTVVYGTGWRYGGWSGSSWCARPVTWGCGVRYNAFSCNWTFRLGGAGACSWWGLRRAPAWRAPSVAVGVGGVWGGARYRQTDVVRNTTYVSPVHSYRAPNLYAQQPDRVVSPRPLPPSGSGSLRHPPQGGHNDGAPGSPSLGRREPPPAPPPSAGHEPPPRPIPPSRPAPPEPRENPRTPPRSDDDRPRAPLPEPPPRRQPAPPEPRENPRTPPRSDHESPKPPPPPPAPRERREEPKSPPPPPAPREHREAPRNPPPPPPPREHHEAPRNPPPPPPPREHREAPKEPPPSPGRR